MDELQSLVQYGTPAQLIAALKDMASPQAASAAFACLEKKAWAHLGLMQENGFDVSSLLIDKDQGETLLHRTVRLHKYDDPADRFLALLSLGADPHRLNSQGLTVLGMLCMHSRDMPAHRTQQALEVLFAGPVKITDSCGTPGLPVDLLAAPDAVSILAIRCEELLPWAQALHLFETTPKANTRPSYARL